MCKLYSGDAAPISTGQPIGSVHMCTCVCVCVSSHVVLWGVSSRLYRWLWYHLIWRYTVGKRRIKINALSSLSLLFSSSSLTCLYFFTSTLLSPVNSTDGGRLPFLGLQTNSIGSPSSRTTTQALSPSSLSSPFLSPSSSRCVSASSDSAVGKSLKHMSHVSVSTSSLCSAV